jgi:DNA-binding Xre family transcriptional regulator
MTFRFNVGRSLRKVQADKRVTNKTLADKIGVHPEQVARWRSSEDLKLSRVAQLASHFEMSIDDFLRVGQ